LVLSGANTYAGSTTISGGVLQADFGVGILASSQLILDGGVFRFNNSSDNIFAPNLGTSGGTFNWTANGGGFSAGVGALNVNVNGGTLISWGTTVGTNLVGTLKLSSTAAANATTFQNAINLGSAARTVQVDDNPDSTADYAILSGVLSGTGPLVKTGSGTLRLTGAANSYTGDTTVQDGQLILAKSAGYAIPGNLAFTATTGKPFVILNGSNQINIVKTVTFSGGAAGFFELHGYNQTLGGISDATGYGVIENTQDETDVTLNSTLTVSNASANSFNGYLRDTNTGTGKLALSKTGGGALTLSGANISYSGGTTIAAGKLVLQDITNAAYLTYGIANNAALDLNATNANLNFAGAISGSGAVNVNVANGHTMTFSGAAGNTCTGITTLSGGDVNLAKTSGAAIYRDLKFGGNTSFFISLLGNNQIDPASKLTWISTDGYQEVKLLGHNLSVAGISDSSGRGVIENTWGETGYGAATLTVTNSADGSFNGYLRDSVYGDGTIGLIKAGAAKLTLSGTNVGGYTGGLTVNAGTLEYSGGTLPKCNYTVTGGTLSLGSKSQSITGFQITGGTVNGTGTLTSSTAYDIQAGTVNPILAGTSIDLNKTGSGTAILANNETYTGLTTVSAGILQLGNGSTTGHVEGNIVINAGGTLVVSRSSSIVYANKVSGMGTLVKSGSRTLTLSGANAFSGNIAVNGGTLDYSGNSTTPAGAYTISAGILSLGSKSPSMSGLKITGGSVTGSGTLISSTAYDVQAGTIYASLGGSAGLVKSTAGTAYLYGANGYGGGTTVAAGTLYASGGASLGATGSPISVQGGATLQFGAAMPMQSNAVLSNSGKVSGAISLADGAKALGSGTFGTVSVLANGTFSPGNSVGSATSGTTTWDAGGKYLFEINNTQGAAGSNWDVWNMTGNLSITGASPFTIVLSSLSAANQPAPLVNFDPLAFYSWLVASTTGTISGFTPTAVQVDTSLFQNDKSQGSFWVSESGDAKQLYLNYTSAVPEPGTLALLLLGMCLLAAVGFAKTSLFRGVL
jgi:fibronectin-binding autotransporter adhesin